MNINEAIKIAKREVKDKAALIYLNAIPTAIEDCGSDGLESQLLYAICNMSTWRGETARQVKAVINKWLKEYRKNAKTSVAS